jgi:hypothetical protein
MGRAYSMHSDKTLKGKDHLGNLSIDWKIILK